MKVSELTAAYVGSWLGYIAAGASPGASEEAEITAALTAAKAQAAGFTGMTEEELDGYEDITIAVLGLCNDYLVNNRPEGATTAMNRMSEAILGMHSVNLL